MTMMTEGKVLLTTFVFGEKYQQYVPLLIYSAAHAYPEYDILIFIYGKISAQMTSSLVFLRKSGIENFRIIENAFQEIKAMTPRISQTLRWLLWDESFFSYDYIYTVDIDMLYIREPLPLHEQHIRHMKFVGLPLSNLVRPSRGKRSLRGVLSWAKHHGLRSAITDYCLGDFSDLRKLTGLHFVKTREYYTVFNSKARENYLKSVITGSCFKRIPTSADDVLLFRWLTKVGFELSRLGTQRNSWTMLDFNNPDRSEFRPHHGIHLGAFRNMGLIDKNIVLSPAYRFYIEKWNEIRDRTDYQGLISMCPDWLKLQIHNMERFYAETV